MNKDMKDYEKIIRERIAELHFQIEGLRQTRGQDGISPELDAQLSIEIARLRYLQTELHRILTQ